MIASTKPFSKVLLLRTSSDAHGTRGILTSGTFSCKTIELPWRNNRPKLSCIPEGEYEVRFTYSPGFKRYLYELLNVKDRSYIRMHGGNFAGAVDLGLKSNYLGCIGVGRNYGVIGKQKVLLSTNPTLEAFHAHMKKQPFMLTIVNATKLENLDDRIAAGLID